MKKIKVYEIHPAANKYPMLTGSAWQDFMEDFAEHGQKETVKLFDGMILDGRHRYKMSRELGVALKVENAKLGKQTPEQYVASQNLHRRHLEKAFRDAMILDLRAAGKSLRTISETMEVPKTTVSRVIDQLSQNGTVEKPNKITGADGRTRTATPKQKNDEPDESEPPTAYSKALDKFIPVKDAIKTLQSARDTLVKYCEKSNPYARGLAIDSAFENIISELRGAAPFCDCPKCNGEGCRSCKNVGWTTKFLAKGIL